MKKILLVFLLIGCIVGSICARESRLAILDFYSQSDLVAMESEPLGYLLLTELSPKDGVVIIVRAQLDQVYKEQKLVLAALSTGIVKLSPGRFKVDYLITGRIYPLGNQTVVNLKMIECATGNVSGTVFFMSRNDPDWEVASQKITKYIVTRLKRP